MEKKSTTCNWDAIGNLVIYLMHIYQLCLTKCRRQE